MTQYCHRCHNTMTPETPRQVLDGRVYHVYCYWKMTTGNQPRVPPPLIDLIGDGHANQLQQVTRGNNNVWSDRNEIGAVTSESDIQSAPVRLHWTSNQ